MSVPDPRPTLEAPDDDPYLWLEEIENARVLDWVEAQNAATLRGFLDEGVGGHSYGKDHDDMAAFISLGYAFLRRAIGWSPD